MTKGQKQVEDFMRFFGQDIPESPIQLSEETAKLRAKLILEEAFETITKGLGLSVLIDVDGDAVTVKESGLKDLDIEFKKQKEVDLKELADGLGDLAYVGEFGTAVAAGIDLEPIQNEIHASNMTKAWTEEDVKLAKEMYPTARLEDYGGGLYRLIRQDGKVIKSPSYREANIAPIIEAQKLTKSKREEGPQECLNCKTKKYSLEHDFCLNCGWSSPNPIEESK